MNIFFEMEKRDLDSIILFTFPKHKFDLVCEYK